MNLFVVFLFVQFLYQPIIAFSLFYFFYCTSSNTSMLGTPKAKFLTSLGIFFSKIKTNLFVFKEFFKSLWEKKLFNSKKDAHYWKHFWENKFIVLLFFGIGEVFFSFSFILFWMLLKLSISYLFMYYTNNLLVLILHVSFIRND